MFQSTPHLLLPGLLFLGLIAQAPKDLAPQEAKTEASFANPQLLRSSEWLAKHAGDQGLRVVDVRSNRDYRAGHVPGAVNIPTDSTYDPKSRGNLGPAKQIASLLGAQGISASTQIVIYDAGRTPSAARVFWSLEVYGHAKLSVLDGGLAKWKHEQRELSRKTTTPAPVEYKIGAAFVKLSTLDQLMDDLDDPEVVMLDSRSDREFNSGRIPAAVHIEWVKNYTDGEIPVFKSPAELRKLYSDMGVSSDKRVHGY